MSDMTDAELIAYARGWLDGYDRGEYDTMAQPLDPDGWRAAVQRWRTISELALNRKLWDAAVARGENPTPFEREEPS